MSERLPELVGLCPVHAGFGEYVQLDKADRDPKCPACERRLLVYAPRAALEEARA